MRRVDGDDASLADGGAELDATAASSGPRLAARAQIVPVHAEPRPGSPKLGYLRAGAIVLRDDKPSSEAGCSRGWYGVRPRGFVCVGDLATLDLEERLVRAASRRPDLSAPLPYAYGIARSSLGPFYARVPTREEAARLEADLDQHLRGAKRVVAARGVGGGVADSGVAPTGTDAGAEYDAGVYLDDVPDFLRDKGVVPNVSGLVKSPRALWAGRPRTKEGFAIVASFVSGPGGAPPDGGVDDRRFDLTTDYLLLPHDRLREVRPAAFHGVELGRRLGAEVADAAAPGADAAVSGLPVAFVRPRHRTPRFRANGAPSSDPPLPARTAILLTGVTRRIAGADYLATVDGTLVKAEDVVRIDPPKSWPAFANRGERWIDVSIARQSLVAYEGTKPVYATLVSTGRDGLGDPDSTKATIRGVYRIHTKHATITMDSNEVGEEFSLRDVPFVQYFETGYAIHGAYWHDGFGEPRSHGCINLAETDASWLFRWTGPDLPDGWHGVYARPLATGTPIWIHP